MNQMSEIEFKTLKRLKVISLFTIFIESEQFDITKDVLKIIKVLKNKISTEGKKYINEANLFTFK